MAPWSDPPTFTYRIEVTSKDFQKGWGKPDVLEIEGKDEQGIDHKFIAYGKNAAQLNRYIYVNNTYEIGVGPNDYNQIVIKSCQKV